MEKEEMMGEIGNEAILIEAISTSIRKYASEKLRGFITHSWEFLLKGINLENLHMTKG